MNLILDREKFSEYDCLYEEYWYDYYDYIDFRKLCKCCSCSAYSKREPYHEFAEENEDLEEMYYNDLIHRFMEKEEEERFEVCSEENLIQLAEEAEFELVLDREKCKECDSSWNKYFDYRDGWRWCKCSRCSSYREAEPMYCKLAEENEQLEEMYYDDLVHRFLEECSNVRPKAETEMDSCMSNYNISTVPLDCLRLILKPFQRCEESFMMSLVCRRWHSVIERSCKVDLMSEILYFAKHGQFNILDWYRYFSI